MSRAATVLITLTGGPAAQLRRPASEDTPAGSKTPPRPRGRGAAISTTTRARATASRKIDSPRAKESIVMRPIHFRTISAGVLAVFAFAAGAAAQQPTSDILAAPQVRELMASQQPGDHAKLRAHFEALSAKYTTEADRHTAFARASAGIPRGSGGAASAHHNRLAANAKESATLVRELATHHGQLGAGVASTAPRNSDKFEKGAGAPATPTDKQMLDLAAKAQTPSEHGMLSEYYTTLVARYTADARDHRAMAQGYRGQNRVNQSAVAHCDRLVQLSDESAKEAQSLAAEHKQMATGR